jgi:hypothetical protein
LAISRNWQTNLSILKKSRGCQGLEDPALTLRSAIDRIFHHYRAKLGGGSQMPAERFSVQWLRLPSPSSSFTSSIGVRGGYIESGIFAGCFDGHACRRRYTELTSEHGLRLTQFPIVIEQPARFAIRFDRPIPRSAT